MSKIEFLSAEGLRVDGRRPHELRKIVCRMGVFKQADGSAYIEMGNTKALATVYGPHEVRSRGKRQPLHDRAIINCEYSQATFSTGERKSRSKGDKYDNLILLTFVIPLTCNFKFSGVHKSFH
eukprot:Colp12_sorted_trinity150504_noHs@29844